MMNRTPPMKSCAGTTTSRPTHGVHIEREPTRSGGSQLRANIEREPPGIGSQASLDALHPPRSVRNRGAADHLARRGLLRVGPPRPAVPRRAVRPVRGGRGPRAQRAGRGGGPSGRAARVLSDLELRAPPRPRVGRAPGRVGARRPQPASSSRPAAPKPWSRRGSWPVNTSGRSANRTGPR